MATASESRRQKILLAILGVLVVAFVARMVLSGGGDDSSGAAATTTPTAVQGATTSTAVTTTTEPGRQPPPDSFDVYSTRNPFEPAFQETPVTTVYTPSTTGYPGTTSTTGYAGTTTTTAYGSTTTTGVGGTTTTTQPSYNPPQGTTVALLDVFFDGPTAIARVQVGSTVYTVASGDVFGPGNSYRVVSLDEPCGQFLYGDSPFELCEGQQVIK